MDFPDADGCERANAQAVFHPITSEGSPPCIEIAGVLVFVYLDPETQKVRVSVHLDGLDPHSELTRDDGTVPLQIDVGPHTVFPDRP